MVETMSLNSVKNHSVISVGKEFFRNVVKRYLSVA